MTPRIVYSPLSKLWYVVTRYVEKDGLAMDGNPSKYLVASKKYDVTDQMTAILKTDRARRKKKS